MTVNETSEQSTGGTTSETGNTSAETATPVDVNISGEEIKVIGRTYAGGEEVHLTAGSMTDEFRNPITEANKGERLILVITGDSVNKPVNRGKTVVYPAH